jgi:hypothetical protein
MDHINATNAQLAHQEGDMRELSAEQQRYASGHAMCLWPLSVLSVVRV